MTDDTNIKKAATTTIQTSHKDLEYIKYIQEKTGENKSTAIKSAIDFYYFYLKNKDTSV